MKTRIKSVRGHDGPPAMPESDSDHSPHADAHRASPTTRLHLCCSLPEDSAERRPPPPLSRRPAVDPRLLSGCTRTDMSCTALNLPSTAPPLAAACHAPAPLSPEIASHSPRFDRTLTHRALSPLQVLVAAEAGNYETASSALSEAQSIIDKNVQRNIIHKNTAARKKSLLTMKVKALEGGAAAAAPVAAE